ncbi:MAG TPA: LptF/LptG family permease [Candidatus Hydrogenedentes bacterium]|jgi:lipopolysaccharide export system permease protein|nr:LptF/LptG family permease [Candidatus Hydrogenedentota bacterium]
MRLTTIDIYLGRRLIAVLVRTLIALVAVFILIDLLTHRRSQILRMDVPWGVVVRYYLAYIPWVTFQVAPLSILVASLMVMGDAAQTNELTAALAGGISLRRFSRVLLLIGLLFSLVLFAAEETIGPYAAQHAERIERTNFQRNPDSRRSGLTWTRLSDGWTCHVLKFNRVALTGEGVLLHAVHNQAMEHIRARRIYWDETRGQWILEDGHWLVFSPGGGSVDSQERITQKPAPFNERPELLFAMDRPPETQTVLGLAAVVRHAERIGVPAQRLLVDFHTKFAQPAVAFIMVWLAIPFAIRVRRGGVAIGFGASVAIALVYLTLFGIAVTLGDAGRLAPSLAAWLTNLVFLAGGITLFLKTPT